MYLDYWKFNKQPFHNVPDPSMYFYMHESVESAVGEILFAIEEGDECLAVLVGEVGLGKTMTFRVVLDSLDQEKYAIAFVTNPDITFPQLLREIVGQLTNKPCQIKAKDALLEAFNRILVETNRQGRRVLLFIDEGNAIQRVNLESLRLLTNMQNDDQNLFTIILAGQPELARKLEHPKLANLHQRIGVYCRLSKLSSTELLRDYIEHRCESAGCTRKVFTDDAIQQIWVHSEKGVPRLINRLCKLSLKAGETNQLECVNGDVINAVAMRFARTTRPPRTATDNPLESRKTESNRAGSEVEPVQTKQEKLGFVDFLDSIADKLIKPKGKAPADSDAVEVSDVKLIPPQRGTPSPLPTNSVPDEIITAKVIKPKIISTEANGKDQDEIEGRSHEVIEAMRERFKHRGNPSMIYR